MVAAQHEAELKTSLFLCVFRPKAKKHFLIRDKTSRLSISRRTGVHLCVFMKLSDMRGKKGARLEGNNRNYRSSWWVVRSVRGRDEHKTLFVASSAQSEEINTKTSLCFLSEHTFRTSVKKMVAALVLEMQLN